MYEGQVAEFAIHRDVVEGVALVTVTGDLDLAGAPELRDTLVQIIDEGHTGIVLDLDEVHFLDSIGLGVLVEVLHGLSRCGGQHGGSNARRLAAQEDRPGTTSARLCGSGEADLIASAGAPSRPLTAA
jgi:anti-anti-sigma factor